MALPAPITPMQDAIEDLKRWERKVDEATGWLESALKQMQWEGRGADAFRAAATQRKAQLVSAGGALKAARTALQDAEEDLRQLRPRIKAAEEAYARLKPQGALPPYAQGTPPPPGDATWPAFMDGKLLHTLPLRTTKVLA